MTAFSNLRIDPRDASEYPRTMDPEILTIAEFGEFPGKFGFQLKDKPDQGTVVIVENNTAQTPFSLFTGSGIPPIGNLAVDYNKGYVFANPADDGTECLCNYDGLGSNASLEVISDLAGAGPTTTKGDIPINDGATLDRFPVSSDGSLIIDNAAASLGRKSLVPGADYAVLRARAAASDKVEYSLISAFPKEQFYPFSPHVEGMLYNPDAGDLTHDWSISRGWAWDTTFAKVIYLSSTIVKRIDASWTVGTGQGGMDTGAVANSTTYYIWAILRSDTGVVDVLFSLSATAPTMPANYDYKRIIGVFKTNGTSTLNTMTNELWGNMVKTRYGSLVNEVSVSTLTASRTTYTLPEVPTAAGMSALLNCNVSKSATAVFAVITALDEGDVVPTSTLNTLRGASAASGVASVEVTVKLNSSAQFGARADSTGVDFNANLKAYFFNRSI
jgi:hypothetical protein